jgi:myo-inositol-1(or 4)-monophosphatase
MESVSDYLAVCEQACRTGGAVIQDWAGKFAVRKKGPADLVTEVDLAAQQAISRVIRDHFPRHDIIGEEDTRDPSKAGASLRNSPYRWIIDPLDGTVNFVHGVPHYAVSVALERNGELLAATVLDPVLDECFKAGAGQGAWLNGRPIHPSNVSALSEALAVGGFPPGAGRESPDVLVFLQAISHCQAVRRSGSAALNLCYIAAGRYDVYWTFSTKIWDVAAGILIIGEAGGAICTPEGRPHSLELGPFLAAANPTLLDQLQKIVAAALFRDAG